MPSTTEQQARTDILILDAKRLIHEFGPMSSSELVNALHRRNAGIYLADVRVSVLEGIRSGDLRVGAFWKIHIGNR